MIVNYDYPEEIEIQDDEAMHRHLAYERAAKLSRLIPRWGVK